jgi:HSP20 family protein
MFAVRPWKEKETVGFPLPRLRSEFKSLYDRMFGDWPVVFEPLMEPNRLWDFDVKEAPKELIVRAEMPGFEAPELEVELRNNRLHIKAENKHEMGGKEKDYECTERRYERFVDLPVETDPAKVVATYRNGVLEIHLPKTEEAAGRRIPVE